MADRVSYCLHAVVPSWVCILLLWCNAFLGALFKRFGVDSATLVSFCMFGLCVERICTEAASFKHHPCPVWNSNPSPDRQTDR